MEHDCFLCVTVVSAFLDFLNQKIGLSFRLPEDCWVRILWNVSTIAIIRHSMRRKKGPNEKNKVFQQKGFNIGNLLHMNWRGLKMKENTGVIILGSTTCALGQFFRPKNPEALKSWCLVLKEESLNSCSSYLWRNMIMLVLHELIEIGSWVMLLEWQKPSRPFSLFPTFNSSSIVPYWQNLTKGQVARGPLKCDFQRPSLCITDERLERSELGVGAERP